MAKNDNTIIGQFVPLDDGGYIAEVNKDGQPEFVEVAGMGLVNKRWVVCMIRDDGILVSIEQELGEILNVGRADDDDDDDDAPRGGELNR